MRQNNTTRTARQVPNNCLSEAEVERVADKLAIALEHDTEDIALLLLLVNHLEACREDFMAYGNSTFVIKQKLFAGTVAASDAQEQFESKALADRGNLLMWPVEKVA